MNIRGFAPLQHCQIMLLVFFQLVLFKMWLLFITTNGVIRTDPSGTGTFLCAFGATGLSSPSNRIDNCKHFRISISTLVILLLYLVFCLEEISNNSRCMHLNNHCKQTTPGWISNCGTQNARWKLQSDLFSDLLPLLMDGFDDLDESGEGARLRRERSI